ncbi:MAG TPA: GNAT family N-acetyltransferase [Pyrinomonadaceae bacterium]|nr:GNAT family N-acetyltransferase [Pyrinomonadaceae bacterium]HMP65479.1 GNAT family N-acetyltransferase [Pyrinomonadaceae bacterium]
MIETDRLRFRPFALEDLPLLIEQRSDPDMYRYLGGTRRQNPEELAKRIQFYISCFETHGFAMCPMILKETGEIIGGAGLQPLEESGEVEVGYNLIKEYWGRGIGTEAARAWLDHGFRDLGLDRIVAVAHPDNIASRRIMEKLGLRYEKTQEHYGEMCVFYAISADEYLAGK